VFFLLFFKQTMAASVFTFRGGHPPPPLRPLHDTSCCGDVEKMATLYAEYRQRYDGLPASRFDFVERVNKAVRSAAR
jgi:hypothetical protein